ncbi:MAG: hypothetical protein Q8N55_04725 [bacterium]|nr:hypothetical protein [bacterium]
MLAKTMSQKSAVNIAMPSLMVKAIFEELKLLRKEVSFILPQDDLKKYANPEKICSSYQKSIKDYPPVSYGNH